MGIRAVGSGHIGTDMDRLETLIDNLLMIVGRRTVSDQFDRTARGAVYCVWTGCGDRAFGGLGVAGGATNDIFWSATPASE